MHNQGEQSLLERYASLANHKVLSSQADIDPKDHAMPQMLGWCRQQDGLVVLKSGTILSSNPSARTVQNCKIVMLNKGLRPGKVMAATTPLIQMILANAKETEATNQTIEAEVSVQQQRLRTLIKEAIIAEASDIHIEVREEVAYIRFRKHGELYLHAEWLTSLGREIASVAFNKETDHATTHFNPLVPQQASMPLEIDGQFIRLRLASLPAHGGFDMVMRILPTNDEKISTLQQLGYQKAHITLIKKAVTTPHGAIILSGPTGSGKTTTLAACISLVSPFRKVYTIEDPVEKVVANATQVPVNAEQIDRSFANMGRCALRMDPDVIVLGEMRDEDTAHVMVRAAITGHLVFSTLHTNSAPAIVTRLADMGISTTLLSDPNVLTCLICQRLIPKLCQTCAQPLVKSHHKNDLLYWKNIFGKVLEQLKTRNQDKACPDCHGLGIHGRTVIAEIIWVDEQSRHFIQQQDILGWEKYLKNNGWTTYHTQALNLIKNGICDPYDTQKVIGEIHPQLYAEQFNYHEIA